MSEVKTLVPKLRFPEFRDAGEWEEGKLGDKEISEFIKDRIPLDQLDVGSYISTVNLLPDFAGIKTATKLPPSGSFTQFIKNDVLISNIRPYLKKVWQAQMDGSASNDVIVIRAKNKIIDNFLMCILKNDDFINYVMKDAKGVKMPRGDISSIKKYPLYYPSGKEQQKIADCLSSIDELITAHSQKHEVLKDHKEGLMQQLFPAEGETVPKLRFPEFRDVGEWEERKLEEVASFSKGKGISKSDVTADGKQPCIRYGELYTHYNETIEHVNSYTNISANNLVLSKANDVIIPASGETQEDIATASCVMKSGIALGGDLNIISSKMNGVFLSYYLNSAKKYSIAQMSQGISVVHLYSSQLKNLDISIPDILEQQKIADCLSSIDELITAQSQKIESLKDHKKGLMQQLLPAIHEVDA